MKKLLPRFTHLRRIELYLNSQNDGKRRSIVADEKSRNAHRAIVLDLSSIQIRIFI